MDPSCVCSLVLEPSTGVIYSTIIALGTGAACLGLYGYGWYYHLRKHHHARRSRKAQDIYNVVNEARRRMDRTSEEFVQQAQQQGRK